MLEVGAFEAKNKLSALLDLVEQGEEVVITRHGKPVARLVKEGGRDAAREKRAAAAAALLEASKGITTGGHSIRSMIDEGRR